MTRALAVLLLALGGCGAEEELTDRSEGALPRTGMPLDALTRRHSRLRERMEARGYHERLPSARVFVTEDRGTVLPLDLATGVCTTITALGPIVLRDLRLTLHDGDGLEAARDEVPGEGGLIHVCPEPSDGETAPFYLVIEGEQGAGAIVLGEFRSGPGEGDGFEGLFDDLLAPRVPFHDVDEQLASARSTLRARGLASIASRVEWVAEGGALRVPVNLEVTHCYVVVARAGGGARDVDLFLFDPAGVEIGRDLAIDAAPSIEICPEAPVQDPPSGAMHEAAPPDVPQAQQAPPPGPSRASGLLAPPRSGTQGSGRFIVEARAFEGEGPIGVLVFGAPTAHEGAREDPLEEAASTGVTPDVAIEVLAADLLDRGFETPVFVSRDGAIVPGESRVHEVVVGPGCALVIASASHQAMDVDLYLADSEGRELDADTAVHPTARVRACRDAATVLRVAVKAYGREGRYALAVLRGRPEIGDVQTMRLEEAIAGPRMRGYSERERWRVRLVREATEERELTIAPGTCLALAAAGSTEVRDVDLVVRGLDGELVASELGPGPYATVSRCAGDEASVLRFSAVMRDGEGELALAILEGPGIGRTGR